MKPEQLVDVDYAAAVRSPFRRNVPSVNELIASFLVGFCARYFSVTSGSPSRIMRCTMIRLLNTIVHVESRNRLVRARKISATPASPAWVATRICSTYLDFGAASCMYALARRNGQRSRCASSPKPAQYLDLRPTLHALLEGARHGARVVLQPGLPGSQETARFVGWSRAVEEVAAVLRWGYRSIPAQRSERILRRVYQWAKGYGVRAAAAQIRG